MMGGEVKFGVADVDYVKAVASEFNVRKRMLPRVLVFPTRARQAVASGPGCGARGSWMAGGR